MKFLKIIWNWILEFKTITEPYYLNRQDNREKGKYRVLYKDGKISEPMCYKVAEDYAEIFGGKVIKKD